MALSKEDKEVIQGEMFEFINLLVRMYPDEKYTDILKLLTQAINMSEISLLLKGAQNQ